MKLIDIKNKILELGAMNAEIINVNQIPFSAEFRDMCKMNYCGMYGKNWMCPPYIGDIYFLIDQAKKYENAIVYMTISEIEDSYDIEGMLEAGERQNQLAMSVNEEMKKIKNLKTLNLGAGGCKICSRCGVLDGKACYFPDKAISSLEAYGISVYDLAQTCGMNYINGVNTVTYFGILLIKEL